jgi:hypothetical protein
MCRELELIGVTYESQIVLPIEYKGVHVGNGYVIDLLIEGVVISHDLHAFTKLVLRSPAEFQRYHLATGYQKNPPLIVAYLRLFLVFRASVVRAYRQILLVRRSGGLPSPPAPVGVVRGVQYLMLPSQPETSKTAQPEFMEV